MNRFEPQRLVTKERYWQFDNADGVEFIAHGDASRHELLWRIIDELETVQAKATHLLESFMKDSGDFSLESVQVLSEKSSDGVDFSLRFMFTADRDRHKCTYTYFDVFFADRQQPRPHFWAGKFTIGFRLNVPAPSITSVHPFTISLPADEEAFSSSSFSAPELKMMRLGLALRKS